MKLIMESWRSYLKEAVSFNEATNNWFYTTLDNSDVPQHILGVLEERAIEVYSSCSYKGDCGENSHRWIKIFEDAGINVQQVVGNYVSPNDKWYDSIVKGEVDAPMSSDHVWLLIDNNVLFDPTAGQFQTNISIEGYLAEDGKPLYI